jgi:hypothetical protein
MSKTYWHLGADRRLPTDYEIATSRLLYHVERGGFAVDLPTSSFHALYQAGSALTAPAPNRWDDFADPRATTYAKYVDRARERESYAGRVLSSIESADYDDRLAPGWGLHLGRLLSPLRFLCHELQMAAAYLGHMAPAGRIAVAALFQCGDEIRRVQRLAYRLALLARRHPALADEGRARWQSDPGWQPLRRAIERLLVTYDWGEAFVALNLCIKPIVDDAFLVGLGESCDRVGAHLDGQLLGSLFEDCLWHQEWTAALVALASGLPANGKTIARWRAGWSGLAGEAAAAAAALVAQGPAGG